LFGAPLPSILSVSSSFYPQRDYRNLHLNKRLAAELIGEYMLRPPVR
jgi:hypothetical protein